MIPENVSNFSGILIVFLISLLMPSKKTTFFIQFFYLSNTFFSVDNNYRQYHLAQQLNHDY